MSTLSIRLPDFLHKELKKLSKKEQISINQLITTSISEKITALETESFFREKAAKGDLDNYLNVLSKVSDKEPEEYDK